MLGLALGVMRGHSRARAEEVKRELPRVILDYEAGPLYVLQNDGRYGAEGTDYRAGDVGQQDNLLDVERLSLELRPTRRHTFVLLYAPLDVVTRVTLERDLQFRDELFAAGTVVDHRYLFDGYRASYLYGLWRGLLGLDIDVDVGTSVQLRDAAVAFTALDSGRFEEQTDIGVVFAFKGRVRYQPRPGGPYALLDADAFSTFGIIRDVRGGIYDVALSLGIPLGEPADLVLRARLLGGGADVPEQEIYNWAHFLSFTAGLRLALDALW